ncbi:glutamate-5-semialdehyde dehydrogenase [Slackia equolifaciens]|uniref:Gamma-glutamyl phosphate reductase n=2 Tax=Slackia equolifaciens TaxID=498718 RepID=A0A3N0AY81_9ACTN|nr:glutamate-5-semialdehyde dehydrogenase [Slackia equolifaciens]
MRVDMGMQEDVRNLALRAKKASRKLTGMGEDALREAVCAMAAALEKRSAEILAANALDMRAGESSGMSAGLLDRLRLDEGRVKGMADGLRAQAATPDIFGPDQTDVRTIGNATIPGLEGVLRIARTPVPLGVVAMVYEARPNVTADAAGACLRSGNACVLRGGSQAINSNRAIATILRDALEAMGLPADCVCLLDSTDRAATDELMRLRGIVDVLVPRGGAGLIRHCVETSLVPVIETGTGNCHIYVNESAEFYMARRIVMNAKTQRVGVCNAAETLLVDEAIAKDFLPRMLSELAAAGVTIHGDATARACAAAADAEGVSGEAPVLAHFVDATEEDWATEYLSMDIAVHVVSGVDEAIEHVNSYGTGHSECIVTSPDYAECASDGTPAARFLDEVDAAAVYVNASTRFTDGGCFGLGAEIGISTQKLHVRGPFAAESLITHKYQVTGQGQVRP